MRGHESYIGRLLPGGLVAVCCDCVEVMGGPMVGSTPLYTRQDAPLVCGVCGEAFAGPMRVDPATVSEEGAQ